MILPITSTLIDSILACSYASDREKTSPSLCGISVTLHPVDGATIAATDGKVLAEHVIPASAAYPGGDAQFTDCVKFILADGNKIRKALAPYSSIKGKPFTLELTLDEPKSAVLTHKGSAQVFPLVQGTFPNYRQALDQRGTVTVGLNPDYLGRLDDLLETKGKAVTCEQGRGYIFAPLMLDSSGIKRRALILPITVPQSGPEMVTMTKQAFDDLHAKTEGGKPTGGSWVRECDHNARIDSLQAHIDELASKTQEYMSNARTVGDELRDLKDAWEDQERTLRDREATIEDLKAKIARPASSDAPSISLAAWMPTEQGKQLKASGLTLDDLRKAGFRWVPADRLWQSVDPDAHAIVARLNQVSQS